jgi:SAM-dependent methyltransferase
MHGGIGSWLRISGPLFREHGRELEYGDEYSQEGIFHKYNRLLPLIDRDGSFLDVGCGVGLMLKFVVGMSRFHIEPFGIERVPEKVEKARGLVLPEFGDNIVCVGYTSEEDFPFERKFDFIMDSTYPPTLRRIRFFETRVRPGGKLMFNFYQDATRAEPDLASELKSYMKGCGYSVLKTSNVPEEIIYKSLPVKL